MTRPAIPWEERERAKAEWAAFVRGLLDRTQWTESQLAEAVGVSLPAVSRWLDKNPHTGRLPSAPAQRLLIDIAKKLGLVSREPEPEDPPPSA